MVTHGTRHFYFTFAIKCKLKTKRGGNYKKFNLAETTRAIKVAKKCRNHFKCIFTGYSNKYSCLIKEANFKFIHLKPYLSEKDIAQIMNVEQFKGTRHPFTYELLKARVENEKIVIKHYQPTAVIIGTTINMFIFSRACQTPLVYIKPLAYARTYFVHGRLKLPDVLDMPFLLRTFIKNIYRITTLSIIYKPKAFSKIAQEDVILPKSTIKA